MCDSANLSQEIFWVYNWIFKDADLKYIFFLQFKRYNPEQMYSGPYFLFLKTYHQNISELLEGGKNQVGNL